MAAVTGIGTTFLRMLAERAWNAGVCQLPASVLTESRHVLQMLRAVLGPTSTRADGYVSHVTIDRGVYLAQPRRSAGGPMLLARSVSTVRSNPNTRIAVSPTTVIASSRG